MNGDTALYVSTRSERIGLHWRVRVAVNPLLEISSSNWTTQKRIA